MDTAPFQSTTGPNAAGPAEEDETWPFADQEYRSSDFNTAMAHLFRAEVSRSNTWRQRLDTTTNWAVVTTAAALSLTFSSRYTPPALILLNTLLILLFLFVEARRYRYYELWAYRVRLLEKNYFAGLLSTPFHPSKESAAHLAESLRRPTFPVTLLEALGRRYRRNYAPIFLILAVSWMLKVIVHPTARADLDLVVERAAVGPIPGEVVILIGFLFNGLLILLGILTVGLRATTSEVFTGPGAGRGPVWLQRFAHLTRRAVSEVLELDLPTFRLPGMQSRKQLVFIISDDPETVGKALLAQVDRGVTLMHGKGMYTGQEHGILLTAVSGRQLQRLRDTVFEVDPKAFVMISPLQDVRGLGFRPLEAH
ncbi:MAG: DUF2270 domain-containing protein [Candidatus Promineifilaceae bacterium]